MVAEMVVMVEMVAVEVMVTVVGTAVMVVETAMVVEEGLDQFERNLLGDHDACQRTNTSS